MKKRRVWIFLSIVLIALFLIGAGVYCYLNSSKMLFFRAVNKTFDNLFEETRILSDFDYDNLTISGTTNFGSMNNAFSMDSNFNYDKDRKQAYIKLMSNNSSVEGLIKDDKVHFRTNELNNKFYYKSFDGINLLEFMDEDNFEHIVELIKDSIFHSLKDEDFIKSKQTIELANTKYPTTKITLKMTEKRCYQIINDILISMKNDKKTMAILRDGFATDTKGAEERIDFLIEMFVDFIEEAQEEVFDLYTLYIGKDKNILRFEIPVESFDEESKLVIDNYKSDHNYRNVEVSLLNQNEKMFNLFIKDTSKEEAKVTLTSDDFNADGIIKHTDSELSTTVDLLDTSGNKLATVTCGSIINKIEDDAYNLDLEFELVVENLTLFNINSKNKLLLDSKSVFPSIDISQSINYDTLSTFEKETIMSKMGL